MLIGELVSKTGISRDTIRFYEKAGLISVGRKERRANNYKEYPESVLEKLLAILSLKGYGFTLNEIRDIISLWEGDLLNCEDGRQQVLQKISAIEVKIEQLKQVKSRLLRSIENCPHKCDIRVALKKVR